MELRPRKPKTKRQRIHPAIPQLYLLWMHEAMWENAVFGCVEAACQPLLDMELT